MGLNELQDLGITTDMDELVMTVQVDYKTMYVLVLNDKLMGHVGEYVVLILDDIDPIFLDEFRFDCKLNEDYTENIILSDTGTEVAKYSSSLFPSEGEWHPVKALTFDELYDYMVKFQSFLDSYTDRRSSEVIYGPVVIICAILFIVLIVIFINHEIQEREERD